MIKKVILSALLILSSSAFARTETIKIYSPYSPGHSGTPALLKIIDKAADQFYEKSISLVRNLQSKYRKQIEDAKTAK